ncbi:MAG: YqaE/Pmp3 family membrane protein [bacterium]|nr:YqaE/Pmp3 family membrane protein [bacterium]
MQILKLILAIFLPPIAAFLQVGFSIHLLINIILTLIGGVPGMIHAIWLVVTDRKS